MIRRVRPDDAQAICGIYNHYVLDTAVTFEEEAIGPDEMAKRIRDYSSAMPWIVVEEEGILAGYAYIAPWRERSAYRYCVESTIYVAEGARRKGFGTTLYRTLIAEARAMGLHCIIGVISFPNEASVALHERCGFHKVAHFEQVGFKFDRWIDVGEWELLL